jgi:hypothetical protein
MSDPGFLRFLDHLSLRLCGCRHKGNQRIPNRLLHRVLGRAIEGEPIDHCANYNAASNKFPDSVGYIGVIPA